MSYLNDFPGGSDGKASAYNAGDLDSIPGSERSPGEGNGNPLQYSFLGNPMERGAWLLEISLRDLEMANLKEQHMDNLCKD